MKACPQKYVKPAMSTLFELQLMLIHRAAEHTQRKVLTTLYHVNELTDGRNCLVLVRLTGERIIALLDCWPRMAAT